MPNICLSMICKNEENYIREALRSARPYITSYSITDTGSTDNTRAIIREEMAGIPGKIHYYDEPFRWDKARTRAVNNAKKPEVDWVLLLDADERISGKLPDVLDPSIVYEATVKYGSIEYTRPNLLSAKYVWKYTGITHEYLSTTELTPPPIFHSGLIIQTVPERANKTPEKCAVDAMLLEQGLKEEPDNSRYQFYLAQSYKDSLQNEKALEAYRKRAEMGGWTEEVYISLLRVAQLSEGLTTFNNVVDAYKAAHAYRPQRAGETMRNLARYCLWWANGTAYPEGERLFVDPSCYLPRVQKKADPLKVLVIIPTQNKRPEMLLEAQSSIIFQTRRPDAVVIAKSDDSFCDKLNTAIRESKCDVFVVLCDDDQLEPTFIEKTVGTMETTGVDIVHTNYKHFGGESCLGGNPNHISITSLFRKSIWSKTSGYANVPYPDWDFVLSCMEVGATSKYIDEPLWDYRVHGGQLGYGDKEANTAIVMTRHSNC